MTIAMLLQNMTDSINDAFQVLSDIERRRGLGLIR